MGVKGLYSYLKPHRRTPNLISPCAVGIDALSVLYKYRGKLEEIFTLIRSLQEKGYTCVVVFDGKAPESKREVVDERRKKREDASRQAKELRSYLESDASQTLDAKGRGLLEKQIGQIEQGGAWHSTRELRKEFQAGLTELGIAYHKADGEADDLLIELYKKKEIGVVLSADMDFLVAGVDRVWVPGKELEELCLSEILRDEEISLAQLQDVAILSTIGSMYTQKAFSWIRHYGSIERIRVRHALSLSAEQIASLRGRFVYAACEGDDA